MYIHNIIIVSFGLSDTPLTHQIFQCIHFKLTIYSPHQTLTNAWSYFCSNRTDLYPACYSPVGLYYKQSSPTIINSKNLIVILQSFQKTFLRLTHKESGHQGIDWIFRDYSTQHSILGWHLQECGSSLYLLCEMPTVQVNQLPYNLSLLHGPGNSKW